MAIKQVGEGRCEISMGDCGWMVASRKLSGATKATARATSVRWISPRLPAYDEFVDSDFLQESLAILTRTPATLDCLLRDLPEVWTSATEGPGTWSPYVVIGHLIHAERTDWIPRLLIVLKHGGSRPFDTFDREAQLRKTDSKSLSSLLDEFKDCRNDSVNRLQALHLTPAQLELRGRHPALGPVTVRQLLATWTAHDLAHILQISRVMAKRYKEEVGPWAQYLSVMK
jgi:hypothetical protein